MDKIKVIIVGAFNEIVELCHECEISIIGIIDNNITDSFYGIPIIGTDEDAQDLYKRYNNIPLILSPDNPFIRKKLYDKYSNIGFSFYNLISPHAHISQTAEIGIGTIIQAGAYVSANSKIGNFCKLNVGCMVMHDNIINDFVTIAPRAVCLGRIFIDQFSYIGANSTILPNIQIGETNIIGAGAVVTKNVDNHKTMIGVPAKEIK